jgi:hypothetical protein
MSDEPLSGRQAERLGNASSANQAVNIFSPRFMHLRLI